MQGLALGHTSRDLDAVQREARGVPLKAVAVKVTDGVFLIGLSGSAIEKQTNLDLIKTRDWFDIPMVYSDRHRAILAIEKGEPGRAIFAAALSDWAN